MPTTQKPIPTIRNITLALLLAATQVFQLFALPLWLLPRHAAWGLLLLPLIPAGNALWSLIHEAIHRLFVPQAKANDHWGRGLAILLGVSLDIAKFGHLMHHRFNREWESEWYDAGKKSPTRARIDYYAKLLGGLYIIEATAAFMFLLPQTLVKRMIHRQAQGALAHLPGMETIACNYFFARGRAKSVRMDGLAIALLYGASAYAYGSHWPWFALMMAGRAFTVSFMDNIYHYATPVDNSVPAKEIAMPRLLSLLLLHANHHHSHHREADVAWHGLPVLRNNLGIAYHQSFWHAARDQFRGPIALPTTT